MCDGKTKKRKRRKKKRKRRKKKRKRRREKERREENDDESGKVRGFESIERLVLSSGIDCKSRWFTQRQQRNGREKDVERERKI